MTSETRQEFDHQDKLSILHHEIPNLVTPIKGFCTTIKLHPAYDSESFKRIREHLDKVNHLTNRITNMTFLHNLILPMHEIIPLVPHERIMANTFEQGKLHSVGQQIDELQARRFLEIHGAHYDPRVYGPERAVGPNDLELLRKRLETDALNLRRCLNAVQRALERIPSHVFTTSQEANEHKLMANDVRNSANGVHTILQAIGRPQIERFGLRKLLSEMDFDHVHAGQPEEIYVRGKRPLLFLALFNLIRNARQHPKKLGDRYQPVQVTAEIERVGGRIRLSVVDTGKGMDDEEVRNIFQLGFSGRGSSGIGTNIAKHVIEEEFSGTINVQSTPGKGSDFTINLGEHPKPEKTSKPKKRLKKT